MRPVWLLVAFLAACGGGSTSRPPSTDPGASTPGEFAEPDRFVPSYPKSDLSRALQKERGAEAAAERAVADLEVNGTPDQLRVAAADLAVRQQFIATLEACEATGETCPPRLDDPPWAFEPDSSAAPPV